MKSILLSLLFILFFSELDAQIYWPNDLEYFKTELPKRHKNLFFKMPKKEFDARVDALIKESMSLPDIAIGVRLQQLFADIGDPHSNISMRVFVDGNKNIPIRTYWFEDGIYITRTSESHGKIVGSKIKTINGHPIETIVDSLSTLLVQDNPSINKAYLPSYLRVGQVLEYFGFVDTEQPIVFSLENKNGTFEEIFEPNKNEKITTQPDVKKLGIGYQDTKTYFWERYLESDSIYFVQYNRCWSKKLQRKFGNKKKAKDLPKFKSFSKKVFATIEEKPINKFIFDMRHNGGGSSLQGSLFVRKLKGYKKVNQRGKLFVIIGRNTFSSAIINTLNFKNQTAAIVIGEETAGSPDHYGEVRVFKMPSSGVQIRYSTKYFNFTKQNLKSILPDKEVPVHFSDYEKGVDAAFEFAKNYAQ
ncbi:MAG: S41 family peptidase [Bacteroidota bacterium]